MYSEATSYNWIEKELGRRELMCCMYGVVSFLLCLPFDVITCIGEDMPQYISDVSYMKEFPKLGIEYLPCPPLSFPVVSPLIAPTHSTPWEQALTSFSLILSSPCSPAPTHSLSISQLPSGAAVTWSSLVWNYSLPTILSVFQSLKMFFPTHLCLSYKGTCHFISLTLPPPLFSHICSLLQV